MPEEEVVGTLMLKTLRLLKQAKEPMLDISRNAGVSFYWLQKFRAESVGDPSVNSVQRLYEYLAKKQLKV